jgi:hypothetical protein
MGFVQHIQVKVLSENLNQNKAVEEKKTKDLQKISCFVDRLSESGLLDQFCFVKR